MDSRAEIPLFIAFMMAAVVLVVVTILTLFGLQISAEFQSQITAHSIGGFTDQGLEDKIGNAWTVWALTPLGLVGSMLLAVMFGGRAMSWVRSQAPDQPPRSGPF